MAKNKNFCPNCGNATCSKICAYCGHVSKIRYSYWNRLLNYFWTEKWYQNPLAVAFVGSIIVAAGQLSSVYMQIYMSSDASDFSISIDKIDYFIYKDNNSLELYTKTNPGTIFDFIVTGDTLSSISTVQEQEKPYIYKSNIIKEKRNLMIEDLHHFLKPYQYPIFITPNDTPEGVNIQIVQPINKEPPFKASMYITFTPEIDIGYHTVTINAIGGDGRERKCTIYVRVKQKQGFMSSAQQMFPV